MSKISRREMLKLIGLGTAGTILAACTPQTTAAPTAAPTTAANVPTPTSGPPVKITMVQPWFSCTQDKTLIDPVYKAINDKMQSEGLNIELDSIVLDSYDTKYPLLYSSGADFTMAFDAPWYKMDSLRTQGALLVMDDLFNQYGSHLEQDITDKVLNASKVNSHFYGIPALGAYKSTIGVILRYDLLQKYGATEPDQTVGLTSLQPFLQAIAKNDSQMIPFAVDPSLGPVHEDFLLPRMTGTWQGVNGKTGIVNPDIDKGYTFVNIEDVPEMVTCAQLLNTWWENNLINKTDLQGASSSASVNTETDYFLPGKTATCVSGGPNYSYFDYQKAIVSSVPDAVCKGYDMAQIEFGPKRAVGALKSWNFIVFNAGAPKAEQVAAVQYYDWLASNQDNIDLWLFGIDGVNYKKLPNLRFSEIPGLDQTKNYRRLWYVGGIPGKYWRYDITTPDDALAAYNWEQNVANFDFDPYEGFNIDTTVDNVATLTAQLQAAWAEAYHGFGTGQVDTTDAIATMKKTLDDAGRPAYMAAIQKQMDAYIAANKA